MGSEEEILTALGLFEVLGTLLHNGAKAFHPTTVYMKQSCTPNTYLTVEQDHSVSVRASVRIAKGEQVTRSLVDVMKCNLIRRRELEKSFFLNCDCQRCQDGSEMGTDFGGLMSQDYNNHIFVPSNPRDEVSSWVSRTVPGAELSGPECCKQLEILSTRCEEAIQEVGGNAGTIEFILNKVKICEEMLELLAKFHPGRNYNAAMLHYEAANAIYGLVKGEKFLAKEGIKHCDAAAEMVEGEEKGSMYDQ